MYSNKTLDQASIMKNYLSLKSIIISCAKGKEAKNNKKEIKAPKQKLSSLYNYKVILNKKLYCQINILRDETQKTIFFITHHSWLLKTYFSSLLMEIRYPRWVLGRFSFYFFVYFYLKKKALVLIYPSSFCTFSFCTFSFYTHFLSLTFSPLSFLSHSIFFSHQLFQGTWALRR